VSRAFEHVAEIFAGGKYVHSPQIVDFFYLYVTGPQRYAHRFPRLPGYYNTVKVRKPQGKCRSAACMAFRELVVVRRLEGANGFAHKWKISSQRAYRKNERLLGIIPWFVQLSVFVEKERRKPTSAGNFVPPRNFDNGALTRSKVDYKDSEIIADHGCTSSPFSTAALSVTTSFISRQSCGQYGTHRPQWMQTNGCTVGSR
jgi:hypothetical protein